MSLELEGEVKDASVNVGNGAIQIGKVSTEKDGVSIVSSSKEGHSQIQGESIEAGGRVRIETRGGGSSKGRVVFGNIKCSGRVTIIAGGGSESEDDDDDAVVVVEKNEKKKRAREEEEEGEEEEEDEEKEEEEDEDDDDIEIEEESDIEEEEEEEEDAKKKRNNKKAKGKSTTGTKEVINLDN